MNVFGVGVIRDFAFAMNVGVIVGTYSSIFIPLPIFITLNDRYMASQKQAGGKTTREARGPSAAATSWTKRKPDPGVSSPSRTPPSPKKPPRFVDGGFMSWPLAVLLLRSGGRRGRSGRRCASGRLASHGNGGGLGIGLAALDVHGHGGHAVFDGRLWRRPSGHP